MTIQAVQSSLFHERRQGSQETVDNYAQDLKKLFYKAYRRYLQAGQETEEMGKAVLSSQFVAGLHRDIRIMLAGQEGTIDQLLVKARFEGTKLWGVGGTKENKPSWPTTETRHTLSRDREAGTHRNQHDRPRNACHGCGSIGHYIRQCPLRKTQSKETHGRGNRKVARISPAQPLPASTAPQTEKDTPPLQPSAASLQTNWPDTVVEDTLESTLVTLHGVSPVSQPAEGIMGPIPTVEIEVEGTPATAIVDTGSPVTIVSLELLVIALAKNSPGEDKDVIKEAIRKRLAPTTLHLEGYGGESIPIVKQGKVNLTRGPYTVEACLQIQSNPPAELLLATDLQSRLGFHLVDLVDSPQPPTSSDQEVSPCDTSMGQQSLPESDLTPTVADGIPHQPTPATYVGHVHSHFYGFL